jgi:uncharacterized protein
MLTIEEKPQGITFKIFVQPKSSKTLVAGVYGDAIKIKLKAPPVDGAANRMCIQFLAKRLKVSKSSLEIISGHTGRNKRLLLRYQDSKPTGTETEALKHRIRSLLTSA